MPAELAATHHAAVWAPSALSVAAVISGQQQPLQPDPLRPGWWTTAGPVLTDNTRYGFIVDGRGPLPDPRSPFQPDGVHGLSCWIDHSLYPWRDAGWAPRPWREAVIYELHIGTFSPNGTFAGVIPHLEALVRLGITHLELMPVGEFPGTRGWGYDGVAIFAPYHVYGGPDGLKQLVDACHAAGLAVILDVVYNHLGPDGNYLPAYGPYFSDRHLTPWGPGVNFDDHHCTEVRRFFFDNARMWLRDYHIDGLRLDAVDKIIDDSPQHFLAELRDVVDQLGDPPRVLIAESHANDPIYVLPIAQGGYGMDAQWNDDLHHAIHVFFTGETYRWYVDYGHIEHWVKALQSGFVYDGCYSVYHGTLRGKSTAGLPGWMFLAYLQTHDQIGNRAHGERFHHHPDTGVVRQKIAAAFILLSPFIPLIFMGEEWAASTPFLYFTDHQDPALQQAVSQGRKDEFGDSEWGDHVPDPQDDLTFERSRLNWHERTTSEHSGMLGWYSELLRLRRSVKDFHPCTRNNVEVVGDPDGRWLWMRRGHCRIVASLVDHGVETPLPAPPNSCVLLQAGSTGVKSSGRLAFHGPGVLIIRDESAGPSPDACVLTRCNAPDRPAPSPHQA